MIPGQILPAGGDIELNAGRLTRKLTVANTGDRPSGVTAFDFRQNWRDRRTAFYTLVSRYLEILSRSSSVK